MRPPIYLQTSHSSLYDCIPCITTTNKYSPLYMLLKDIGSSEVILRFPVATRATENTLGCQVLTALKLQCFFDILTAPKLQCIRHSHSSEAPMYLTFSQLRSSNVFYILTAQNLQCILHSHRSEAPMYLTFSQLQSSNVFDILTAQKLRYI